MNDLFKNNKPKFIDLFAGIGGFHLAIKKVFPDAECVFSSEINKKAAQVYEENYGINPLNDIRTLDPGIIPNFDILCAGFPCQSFSKAGYQKGFEDERGNLFFDILKIIDNKISSGNKPSLLVLENVRNLATHDEGNTWEVIHDSLVERGYNLNEKPLIVSPTYFDIPQLRDRTIIIAVDNTIFDAEISFNITKQILNKTIYDILEPYNEEYLIPEDKMIVLNAWDDFIRNIGPQTIGFPIWTDEFYSKTDQTDLPEWKQNFINKNIEFYKKHKKFIDKWYKKYHVSSFVKAHRKFEWQANSSIDSLFEGLIQFRPSGIRVKVPSASPTLVAMAHVPIVGNEKRYLTPLEVLRLQSFPDDFKWESVGRDVYRLVGNAVNVDVISNSLKQFLKYINYNGGINDE